MPFTQGQILENEDGRRKVLGVCGEVYFLSSDFLNTGAGGPFTEDGLIRDGFKPVAEKWKPELGGEYWCVGTFGKLCLVRYVGSTSDEYQLSIGNCFKTEEEAEKYKQWLLDNPYPQGK